MVRPYDPPRITTELAMDCGGRWQPLDASVLFQYPHQPLGPGCVSNAIGTLLHYVGQRDELVVRVQLRPIQQCIRVNKVNVNATDAMDAQRRCSVMPGQRDPI